MAQRYLFFAVSSPQRKPYEPGSILVEAYVARNLEEALDQVQDLAQKPVSTLDLASPYVLISGPEGWGLISRDPLSLVMAGGPVTPILFRQNTLIWPGGQWGMNHHVYDIRDIPYTINGLEDDEE